MGLFGPAGVAHSGYHWLLSNARWSDVSSLPSHLSCRVCPLKREFESLTISLDVAARNVSAQLVSHSYQLNSSGRQAGVVEGRSSFYRIQYQADVKISYKFLHL